MIPSCSKPMMRFTTLVNPNTAYTRTEETAAENTCRGRQQGRGIHQLLWSVAHVLSGSAAGVIRTDKQAASAAHRLVFRELMSQKQRITVCQKILPGHLHHPHSLQVKPPPPLSSRSYATVTKWSSGGLEKVSPLSVACKPTKSVSTCPAC